MISMMVTQGREKPAWLFVFIIDSIGLKLFLACPQALSPFYLDQ
jgi:hypothetical protein